MTSLSAELLTIFALVLANGFFSGAEIAIVAMRKGRIQELADQGRRSARAVLALRNNPERFLATVQVGITVVGATAAAFGGEVVATRLAPILAKISWVGEHANGAALGLVVAAVSYLSIVVGELVPKSLALRNAERYALLVGRGILALSWLARPLVWFLGRSANLLLKPFRDSTTFTEARHSADELQELVDEAAKAGSINADAGEIAARALELPALAVSDVMVPRRDVLMLPVHAPREEVRRSVVQGVHSRIPIYEERIDNVIGYINMKDLLIAVWGNGELVLRDLLRPPFFVPESKPAMDLLKEMRARHTPFAIVVDEQGGLSGIVTMEDVLEELVGEMFSEHEPERPQSIRTEPDGSVILNGLTPIREANRVLDLELPQDGWSTVAGLCLALAGRIPENGEVLRTDDGTTLEILDASPKRVRVVRVRAPAQPAENT